MMHRGFIDEWMVDLQRRRRFDAAAKSGNEVSMIPLEGETIGTLSTLNIVDQRPVAKWISMQKTWILTQMVK
jgi:hypothetical protein